MTQVSHFFHFLTPKNDKLKIFLSPTLLRVFGPFRAAFRLFADPLQS